MGQQLTPDPFLFQLRAMVSDLEVQMYVPTLSNSAAKHKQAGGRGLLKPKDPRDLQKVEKKSWDKLSSILQV